MATFFVLGNRHFLAAAVVITLVYTWVSIFQPMRYKAFVNFDKVLHCTDEKFLSFALDTSFVHKSMKQFTKQNWSTIVELASLFSPCYLRLGGTDADRLLFSEANNTDYVILTREDWIKINSFVIRANLSLLFDFNVLLRNGNAWDSRNAKEILKFSKSSNFKADYQLGNEPNSFLHVFNVSVTPKQLCDDFKELRRVLNSGFHLETALLVGPDVTEPKNFQQPSISFLKTFLSECLNALDAVTWHQYYVNGRDTSIAEFLSPEVMDRLRVEIGLVTEAVRSFSKTMPIWLGETGSAYGGGARGLSNKFVSTFLLVDKLGLSAQLGIDVVVRQTFYQGHYALIDDAFNPNPDFWISFLYKKLVGSNVYDVFVPRENKFLRVYSQNVVGSVRCLRVPNLNASMVTFAVNLGDLPFHLIVVGSKPLVHCATYVFTSVDSDLQSSAIQLNGKQLVWNEVRSKIQNFTSDFASFDQVTVLPAYSIAFWVFS